MFNFCKSLWLFKKLARSINRVVSKEAFTHHLERFPLPAVRKRVFVRLPCIIRPFKHSFSSQSRSAGDVSPLFSAAHCKSEKHKGRKISSIREYPENRNLNVFCHLWNFFSNFHFIERKSKRSESAPAEKKKKRAMKWLSRAGWFTRDLDCEPIDMWHLKTSLHRRWFLDFPNHFSAFSFKSRIFRWKH